MNSIANPIGFSYIKETSLINSINKTGYQNIKEGFVSIEIFGEKLDISFAECGSVDSPALVCLHGNSGSSQDFYKQFKSLSNQYRVIAFDLPGHGKSSCVANDENKEKIYSFPGYAQVIAKAIKAFGLNDIFVLGFSLGGHNALSFLAKQNDWNDPEIKEIADKIKAMIIIGTPPLDLSLIKEEELIGEFVKGFRNDFIDKLSSSVKIELEELGICNLIALISFDKNLNDGFQKSNRLAEFFITLLGIELNVENQFMVEAVKNTCGEARKYMIANMLKGGIDNQRATVEEAKIPLLITAGEGDRGIDLAYLKTLNLPPAAQLKILPGGHAIFLDNGFNDEIISFLNSIK